MILVAHDLSSRGDAALELAREWAQRLRWRLTVVHVIPEGARPEMLFPQANMQDALTAVDLNRAVHTALTAKLLDGDTLEILEGSPGEEILRLARERNAELIVLGDLRDDVLKHAHLPVMIARRHAHSGRFVTALALEDQREPQLDVAFRIAKAVGGSVIVTHVLRDDQELSEEIKVAMRRARAGMPEHSEIVLERGEPAAAIVAVAERAEAEMIVVGTHARTGLARMVLGSVASEVVRKASCSVLVVPLR